MKPHFYQKAKFFNTISHAVILNPKNGILKVKDSGNILSLSTSGIIVNIQKLPFKISYQYKEKELLSEKSRYTKKDSTEILDFNLDKTKILYGGGARAIGMNRRGNRL